MISAVGHETDVTLSDLAADVRAPTPSAAAEIVAASRADLLGRVGAARDSMMDSVRQRMERVHLLMAPFAPENLERNLRLLVQPSSQRLDDAREQLVLGFRELLTASRHRLELASRELASYSPLDILARGYAVVTHDPTGRILLSPEPARPGDRLSIRLSRGGIRATVEDTHAGSKG